MVSVGDEFIGNCLSPSFSCLERLTFCNMSEWKEWCFSEAILEGGIFPRLTELNLSNCPKLNVGLPGYLPSLKRLNINECHNMVVLFSRTQQSCVRVIYSILGDKDYGVQDIRIKA